jgi:Family of unknown function (DUF6527)
MFAPDVQARVYLSALRASALSGVQRNEARFVKLTDLNPVWTTPEGGHEPNGVRILVIDCPCGQKHRRRIPLGQPKMKEFRDAETTCFVWQCTSYDLAGMTLYPSLDFGCWHGYVKNGELLRVGGTEPVKPS